MPGPPQIEEFDDDEAPRSWWDTAKAAWDWANRPLIDAPSRAGQAIQDYTGDLNAQYANEVARQSGTGTLPNAAAQTYGATSGMLGGMARGAGDVLSSFTSPLSIATMGMGKGATMAAQRGLPMLANALTYGNRALGAAQVASGVGRAAQANTVGEFAQALPEIATGALGASAHAPAAPTTGRPRAVVPKSAAELGLRPAAESIPTRPMTAQETAKINPESVDFQPDYDLYNQPNPEVNTGMQPDLPMGPSPTNTFANQVEGDVDFQPYTQPGLAEVARQVAPGASRSASRGGPGLRLVPRPGQGEPAPMGSPSPSSGPISAGVNPDIANAIKSNPTFGDTGIGSTPLPPGLSQLADDLNSKPAPAAIRPEPYDEYLPPPAVEWKPPVKTGPSLSLLDEGDIQNNASGDSSASVEAMNRQKAMTGKGEQFGVYDRGGKFRPLLGTDAVDYTPSKGETYGIQGPSGFRVLNDQGGRAPRGGSAVNPKGQPSPFNSEDIARVGREDNLFKGSKGEGLGNKPFEEQWSEALEEAKLVGIDPTKYDNLDELQWDITRQAAIQTMKTGKNPLADRGDISKAIVTGKGGEKFVKMGIGDPTEMIQVFRNTYAGNVAHTAGKELLQNAIDATANHPGGEVHVYIDKTDNTVSVHDNGPGLNEKQIGTWFTDLSSSGKRGGPVKTIGEMGVGKTSYLVAGEHVEVESTTRDKSGQLVTHRFSGTPEEIIGGTAKIEKIPTAENTTGTSVKMKIPQDEDFNGLTRYLDHFEKYSDSPVPVHINNHEQPVRTVMPKSQIKSKPLYQGETPYTKYTLTLPENAQTIESDSIPIIINNRGMFQGVDAVYNYGGKADLPDRVILNVDPTVKATDPKYPLTAPTRERLKDTFKEEIRKQLDAIIKAGNQKKTDRIQGLFDELKASGDKFVIHDGDGKYTPEEVTEFKKNPVIYESAKVFDNVVKRMSEVFHDEMNQARMFGPDAKRQVAKIGYILDDDVRGINLRNPSNKDEFVIMLNPLSIFNSARTPKEAAQSFVHVIIHEFTHNFQRSEGANYTAALADLYTRFDLEEQLHARNEFEGIFGDQYGNYHPEVSELLQQHTQIGGRPATKKDPLKRERSSEYLARVGQEGIPGGNKPNGEGVPLYLDKPTPERIKAAIEAGYEMTGNIRQDGSIEFIKSTGKRKAPILESEVGMHRPTQTMANQQLGVRTDLAKPSVTQELYNLPRGILASYDLSAPLRQGIGLIHKQEFRNALVPMFKSLVSENAFRASQNEIANRPLFKKRIGPGNKELPSFAEDAGLFLADLGDLSKREEVLMSNWAEKVPGVRPSNRAYTTFLNKLRADTFESLVRDGKVFGANAQANLPLARAIADFVNTASGRGNLGKLERASGILGNLLFSPRLIASRIKMLNPAYYWAAPPFVRKEALKSLFAIAGAGQLVLQLGKMAGGTVETDPRSSDFEKLKVGNTRLDPWGGFQQYMVAATRLASGGYKSSGPSQKMTNIYNPKGPYDSTAEDVVERFVRGKTHPVLGFAWSLAKGGKEISGEKMHFDTMNPMKNAIMQRFIPILWQDLYELSQEEPELLPFVGPPMVFGMGSQTYGGNPNSRR